MYFCLCVCFFRSYSLCARTVRTNAKNVDRGRQSGHHRRRYGAVRAVCRRVRVARAQTVVFGGRRYSIRRFRGFSFLCQALLGTRYPLLYEMLVFFCSYVRTYSLKSARLATALPGCLCRDRFGVHSSEFGRAACRVPCVTRACAYL